MYDPWIRNSVQWHQNWHSLQSIYFPSSVADNSFGWKCLQILWLKLCNEWLLFWKGVLVIICVWLNYGLMPACYFDGLLIFYFKSALMISPVTISRAVCENRYFPSDPWVVLFRTWTLSRLFHGREGSATLKQPSCL